MDWSKIILSLVIALITEQIVEWAPQVSKFLIYGSTRLLPEGLNNRMFEEWCADLNDIKGKCCQLIFAMQTYLAVLQIRQEAFGQIPIYKLVGYWQYTLVSPEVDIFWAGDCRIGFDLRGLHFKGHLKKTAEDQPLEDRPDAPWYSTAVNFKWLKSEQKVGLSVRYILNFNNQEIPGEFTVSYQGPQFRNRLSGTLSRSPVVDGRFRLRKTG